MHRLIVTTEPNMRLIAALLTTVCLLPAAHALKCKSVKRWLTPFGAIAPNALVVAHSTGGGVLDRLVEAKPHFIDGTGAKIAAEMTRNGNQLVLRPAQRLKGTTRIVAPGWPEASWKVIQRKIKPPVWTADPTVTTADESEMGRYGKRWRRIIAMPLKHARLVKLSFKGTEHVRYLRVSDEGTLDIHGGPCGNTLSGVEPGKYTVTVQPVGAGGAPGPEKSMTLDIPSRR